MIGRTVIVNAAIVHTYPAYSSSQARLLLLLCLGATDLFHTHATKSSMLMTTGCAMKKANSPWSLRETVYDWNQCVAKLMKNAE